VSTGLAALTLFHVGLSLVGIVSGFVVVYGLLTAKRLNGWTATFLSTTLATSLTGFLFPVHKLLPSHVIGILSTLVLAIAIFAFYQRGLAGAWRRAYVVNAIIGLYLNVFILIAQLFMRVPALKALAPTRSAPAFQIAQLSVLIIFVLLGIFATRNFEHEQAHAA